MHPSQPLQYPRDFPPCGGWKRFFLGVRWLGPDLSFFKQLRSAQASRSPVLMDLWGGGARQALATKVGTILAAHCDWPSPCFLPGDSVRTIAGGSRFGWPNTTDEAAAVKAIEKVADVPMGDAFWTASGMITLGQLVDQLLLAAENASSSTR